MSKLFEELKRRNVIRVGIAYVVGAWLVAQAADLVLDVLGAPDVILQSLVAVLAIGFIPALVFAWAFEITPEGIKKESEVDRTQSITQHTAKKLDIATMVLVVAAVALLVLDRFIPEIAQEPGSKPGISEATQTAEQSSSPAPPKKSIAVLPFANRSTDADESQFFSDGIHDDLLTHLSKINDLKVISRTSVMSYRDTDKNMRQIGEELGVATLLEGGVQRAGKRVRINAQLIDAQTDEHLWAEIFDRELTTENIFDIQQEISLAIAAALEAELSPQEEDELATIPTQNLVAYEQWLASRQHLFRSTVESNQTAIQMLRSVIAIDPGFEPAYVDLANAELNLVATGAISAADAKQRLEPLFAKALELNPRNGTSWANKGALAQMIGEEELADELLQKALELSPNDADVREIYGYILVRYRNRPDLALPLLEKAAELNPLSGSVLFTLGRAYDGVERTDEARATFARARHVEPDSAMGFAPMAGIAIAEGQIVESLSWSQQAMERDPLDVEMKANQAFLFMTLGDMDEAEILLKQAEQEAGREQPLPMAARVVWNTMAGRPEAASELAQYIISNELPDRWGSDAIVFRTLHNQALSTGNLADALAAFRKRHPSLFTATPEIKVDNILQAVDLSSLLQASGQNEQAETLLQAILAAYDQPYFATGGYALWIVPAKAEALVLLGRQDEAIAELQRIVDKGWRITWQWDTELNPIFDSLRDDPRYLDIINFLQQDMERQKQEWANREQADVA